jgi:hypothetical protein
LQTAEAGDKEKAAEIVKEAVQKRKATEAVVDVETKDAKVEGGTIDEALDQLDPKPPAEDKPVDHPAMIRKLMVEVVKVHGPKGAKLASQVVNRIAGVKDVTKIPAEKADAVREGLLAAINSDADGNPNPPAPAKPEPEKPPADAPQEDAPDASDVDF